MASGEDDGRGNRIALDERFLARIVDLWHQVKAGTYPRTFGTRHSLASFGRLLAETTGRDHAWSDASLTRYLDGEQVTDRLTWALCEFFDLDYPIFSATDPEEARWFAIGRRLRELDREFFEETLAALDKHVAVSQQQQDTRHQLRSTLLNLQAEGVVERKGEAHSKPSGDERRRRPRRVDRDR